jgi:formylglycine-generating enzyme required for sulfatase activity
MGSTLEQIDLETRIEPSWKKEWANGEQPQHSVRITRPFYLGAYEVTREQFAVFVEATGYKTEAELAGKERDWRNPGWAQERSHPVAHMAWSDAAAFCEWLTRKEGKTYRMPTEAEWEYACRAGTTTLFHSGDDLQGLATVGNMKDFTYHSNWSGPKPVFKSGPTALSARDYFVYTAPVGSFRSNAFGLFDMHGNINEWCYDWFGADYYAESPEDDPQGPPGGSMRIARGGCFDSGWEGGHCWSAARMPATPSPYIHNLGFRVARAVVDDGGREFSGRVDKSERAGNEPAQVQPNDAGGKGDMHAGVVGRPDAGPALKTPSSEGSIENSIGMTLKLIPAGEFLMGSPDDDKDAEIDEKPLHRVRITRPFYLGVYEVTQAQYVAVMGNNPSWFSAAGEGKDSVAGQSTDRHPVEQVSSLDAAKFCNKLGEMEGLAALYEIDGEKVRVPDWNRAGYRLPTEAEWEYACRANAPTVTRYSFGDDAASLGEFAWYEFNSGLKTHPVGEKRPNGLGLFDMHGNMLEWCWDWHDESYYKESLEDDPRGLDGGSFRVIRGGGWNYDPRGARSALRDWNVPGSRDYLMGFRVARVQSGR